MPPPELFDLEWFDCEWERREFLEFTDMSKASRNSQPAQSQDVRAVTVMETLDRGQPH
jgi:hypothetical protein